MTYNFRYRGGLFFKSVKVIGHMYNRELDRMTLLKENGGIFEIAHWSFCDCELGTDWVLAKKKEIEKQSGQPIVIDRDLNAK